MLRAITVSPESRVPVDSSRLPPLVRVLADLVSNSYRKWGKLNSRKTNSTGGPEFGEQTTGREDTER